MALTRIQPPAQPVSHSPANHSPTSYPIIEAAQVAVESEKIQTEQARMANVMLLLEAMFDREDVTMRLILNYLYDIGSVNLINQRVANRPLNRLARCSARFSKPVVKIIVMRWFKRNCPKLITNWLYNKVKFEPKQIAQIVEEAEELKTSQETIADQGIALRQASTLAELEGYRQKIRLLQARVRLLTLLLMGVTLTLGGGWAWSVWQSQPHSPVDNVENRTF